MMRGEPLVSVVVLSYNYGHFLAQCLDSIFGQDGIDDFEVILVDDASADDSASVAQRYADPRLRFIRHDSNQGHIATVTDGLRRARGTYVARIDCDDRYRPDYLCQVVDVFKRHPEVGLVYGDAALIDQSGEISAERSDSIHGGRDFRGNELIRLLEKNIVCAPTVIARRAAWLDALPIPDGLAFHDWYFTVMIARRYDFYYVNHVLAEYRVHAGNLHTRIARNKSEETSIFRLLDRVFSEPEASRELEAAKRRARRRVYGAHYLTLADKYFGFRMDTDARRCYLLAASYRPRYLLRADVVCRLAATVTGRGAYDLSKSLVKSALIARRGTVE